MEFFNKTALIKIRDKEYTLQEHDLELLEMNTPPWEIKNQPPFELCFLVYDMVTLRYGKELDENTRKKLSAAVLGMSYFQYADILFKVLKLKTKRGKSAYRFTSMKRIMNFEIERARLVWEKKKGKKISPKEFEIMYRTNKQIKEETTVRPNISPRRKAEYKLLLEKYEASARDCIKITPTMILDDNLPIGSSKLGGMADMLIGEEYPLDHDGLPMKLLCQLNISEVASIFPDQFAKKQGLLSFFISTSAYFNNGPYQKHHIRFRPILEEMKRTPLEHSEVKLYSPHRIDFEKTRTIPWSPWPIAEEVSSKMSEHYNYYHDFIEQFPDNFRSSILGYTSNSEMELIENNGNNISDKLEDYIPLLHLKSHITEPRDRALLFGDGGGFGFFIKPEDWNAWKFEDVVLSC